LIPPERLDALARVRLGGRGSAMRLGHAHLKIRDLDRSVSFYTRFLGLRVTEKVGSQLAFLTGGDLHHELALQEVGSGAPDPPVGGVGLYHVAFEAAGRAELASVYEALTAAGVVVLAVDHRISWALYFADPDGNGLELYWDTRGEPFGAWEWRGFSQPLTIQRLMGKEG